MRIAVVGGGVTGCSVAWHLAERGLGEVTLFERDRAGSGTTWHSAGNITWKPLDDNDAQVLYMYDLVDRFEAGGEHRHRLGQDRTAVHRPAGARHGPVRADGGRGA